MSTSIVFAGSPDVAVPYLRALYDAGFDIRAVITREDSRQGRKGTLTSTAVASVAEELGLSVVKTNSLRDVDLPEVHIGVVVAYGGLVPPRLLDEPAHGWVNVHFSLLPKFRGAAPLQRAMWDGEPTTGVSIFRLVEELDARKEEPHRPQGGGDEGDVEEGQPNGRVSSHGTHEPDTPVANSSRGGFTKTRTLTSTSLKHKVSDDEGVVLWRHDVQQEAQMDDRGAGT
jgi:methionyl-tRNA formyltransferase